MPRGRVRTFLPGSVPDLLPALSLTTLQEQQCRGLGEHAAVRVDLFRRCGRPDDGV